MVYMRALLLVACFIRTMHAHAHAPLLRFYFAAAISTGTKLVDQAAGLVPESVPRSVAKGGVALLGTLFVFGLIQKVRKRCRSKHKVWREAHATTYDMQDATCIPKHLVGVARLFFTASEHSCLSVQRVCTLPRCLCRSSLVSSPSLCS